MERVRHLRSHLTAKAHKTNTLLDETKSDHDVVVVSALRTPLAKAKRGAFREMTPDILLEQVLRAVIHQARIDPALIDDVCVGNVLQPGAGAAMARIAQLSAGIPYTVPVHAVNRQCASGLQAFASVASSIQSSYYEIGIACGVESMSFDGMNQQLSSIDPNKVRNKDAIDCLIPMGITSENVASKYGISREKQDVFAAGSHEKAVRAQRNGTFNAEIVPVNVTVKNGDDTGTLVVTQDDGIRPDTTVERLGRLKPVFKSNGSTTAGNSSQLTDGAAAAILMRRVQARKLGLPILGRFVSYSVAGVPPSIMGIGPSVAIPKALADANLTLEDIDIFEINEAFASQVVYCIEKLGISADKVNPNGGAIALGHPLGCTGVRQVVTLLHGLKRRKQRFGVVSMCAGTGMGAAAVFESEC